jgi:hypothetical protein
MNTFIVVNPRRRAVEAVDANTVPEVRDMIGLGNVDHGIAMPGLGYCVYEFSLFVPPSEQHYFGLRGTLFAGPTIFYAFDAVSGETLRLRRSEFPEVRFYLGINDVEAAIQRGEVERPFMAVNGVRLWEWPQPAPESMR